VAKEAQENPKNFVKPLVASDVLLLWIKKPGAWACRWRIMCLMESITMRSAWIGTEGLLIRIACPDLSRTLRVLSS